MSIAVDGKMVAQGDFARTALVKAGIGETFDVGEDSSAPVVDYGETPRFTGESRHIVVQRK